MKTFCAIALCAAANAAEDAAPSISLDLHECNDSHLNDLANAGTKCFSLDSHVAARQVKGVTSTATVVATEHGKTDGVEYNDGTGHAGSFATKCIVPDGQACASTDCTVNTCQEPTATAYDHHDGSAIDVQKKYKYFVVSRPACHDFNDANSYPLISDYISHDLDPKVESRGVQPSRGTPSTADTRNTGTQASPIGAVIGSPFTCANDQGSSGVVVRESDGDGDTNLGGGNSKKFDDKLKRLRGEFVIEYDAMDRAGNKAQQLVFAMIMVDNKCPEVERNTANVDVDACDMDKNMNNRNDMTSRNQVTTNERQIGWTDNYDGSTPWMSAATTDVRKENLFYKFVYSGMTADKFSNGYDNDASTNAQQFFDSFAYTDKVGSVTVEYTGRDYANIFGSGYEDNSCTVTDSWTIKDDIAPRVVQRFSNQEPVCPLGHEDAGRCRDENNRREHNEHSDHAGDNGSGTETDILWNGEVDDQRINDGQFCHHTNELTVGTVTGARASCQCFNFRRAWGTATDNQRNECVAYTSSKIYFDTVATGTTDAVACEAVNKQTKTVPYKAGDHEIPVTYFECGDLAGYKEMGFKCIDIRDSFHTTNEVAPHGYDKIGTWNDGIDYDAADQPRSYFIKTKSTDTAYHAVTYNVWTETSTGVGTIGDQLTGPAIQVTGQTIKDFDISGGYHSTTEIATHWSNACKTDNSFKNELPLFNHGAAFLTTYSCTDKALTPNVAYDPAGMDRRITKVVDTLAPTLKINAQGMEEINKVEVDGYSLRTSDNGQKAFSDYQAAPGQAGYEKTDPEGQHAAAENAQKPTDPNDNYRTTAAGTQVQGLKKMNSHYHTSSLINQFAGDEEGQTCDRSGKTWRQDWIAHTHVLDSHIPDKNWDVDSYVIQHSAGFDSDEQVITNLEVPYKGYSCFDQCDGDLTHTRGDDVTTHEGISNTHQGVTLTWHDGYEGANSAAGCGCAGRQLPEGFKTLVPGTYALKYSCQDEAGHVTSKCRTVLNEDHTKPIITVLEADQQTYEATRSDNYVDAGATCSDEVDGNISQDVEVSGDVVNLARVGVYTIKYNCQDSAANTADEATRTVVVQDTSCPSCVISEDNTEAADHATHTVSIEASFPYNDVGAVATDSLQGSFGICSVWSNGVLKSSYKEIVNVESTGTYYITYRVKDSNGNWNDNTGCTGGQTGKENVRTVVIIDTLRPVIQLKYNSQVIHEGAASFATGPGNNNRGNNVLTHTEVDGTGDPVHLGNGYENPAHSSVAQAPYTHTWSENMNLMAEQATTSSVNGWVVGAVGSAVTGLALLGYSLRKSAAPVATSVPV